LQRGEYGMSEMKPDETDRGQAAISVEIALSEDDYAHYAVHMATRSRFARRRYLASRVAMFTAGPVAVAALCVAPAAVRDAIAPGLPVGMVGRIVLGIVLGVISGAMGLWWRPRSIARHARRVFRTNASAAWAEPGTLRISPEGLSWRTRRATSDLSWSAVIAMECDANAIYLMQSSENAFVIPRRVFASEAAVSDVMRFMARMIAPGGGASVATQ
jgi:hypothetical protein